MDNLAVVIVLGAINLAVVCVSLILRDVAKELSTLNTNLEKLKGAINTKK